MPDSHDLIAFLRGLRAIRQFRDEPVPPAVVDDLLDIARWSGSAKNRQPWEFIVVRDPETLRQMATMSPYTGHLAGAALAILLVMAGEDAVQETYDDGRLSERLMLAAKAHGVGSCIGWFDQEAGAPAAKALLGIPEGRLLRTAISFGYAADPASRRPGPTPGRKPLAEIAYDERYGNRREE